MATAVIGKVSWERMCRAVEKVRDRLLRATTALEAAGVPYAVIGGNAVAAWVSRVDEAAVRNTRDVDLLVDPADFAAAREALEKAGFHYRHARGVDMFLEAADASARDAIHIVFAGKRVRPEYEAPAPRVEESERSGDFQLLELNALVKMKLTSFRDKDRMHLRDLIDVGLVDASWREKLTPALWDRLERLLEDPEG